MKESNIVQDESSKLVDKVFQITDRNFSVFKLTILGLMIIAIPLLFFLQVNKSDEKDKENESTKQLLSQSQIQVSKLESELQFKNDVIKLYSDLLGTRGKTDTERRQIILPIIHYDTVRSIYWNYFDKRLITSFSHQTQPVDRYDYDTIILSNDQMLLLKQFFKNYKK